ncbi:MAG: M23 family metallopeptidase [Gemmatimonadetes bacterium]|nr:M23 family metallopeptidase [Gemmatimonadota bacterium]
MTPAARTLAVALGALVLGGVVLSRSRPMPQRVPGALLDAAARDSARARWHTRVDTVRRGEQLAVVLERAGIPGPDAAAALAATRVLDARRVRAGTAVTTRVHADSGPAEIVFQLAIDRLVRLSRRSGTAWDEREERLPWQTDTVVVGAIVSSTLTAALERGAEAFPEQVRAEVAYALADILEYRVDLSRDLRQGDSVRMLIERQRAPNGLVRPGNILAARVTVDGRPVETVRFMQRDRPAYFDGEGKAMRAAFLRAPLAFRRISSVFGMRRHPILGILRAHQGTDYAAAAGTPVRALGDGRVIFAGWKGGYGRVVEIRHRNGFVTRYGHLNGFAKGIRAGASVGIANTIGFVGATGLATAPHLHFEVLVGGRHRDPRQVLRNMAGEPLAAAHRPAFLSLKSRVFALLDASAGARSVGSRELLPAPRGD